MKVETAEKLERLRNFLKSFKSALIAFSGGVDSATLTAICKKEIERVLAVTIRSQATPSREIEITKLVAKEIGVEHEFIDVDLLKLEEFTENSRDRCYFCKKKMLKTLISLAERKGFEIIFDGTNLSDLKGDRPGYKAVMEEKKVISPWVKFGFEKDEIREIAGNLGLSVQNSPSLPCLATRIPYGIKITPEALKLINDAENYIIKTLGIKNVRVRNVNGIAVIEMGEDELGKILEKTTILEVRKKLHDIGFRSILLNLDCYSEGSAKNFRELI